MTDQMATQKTCDGKMYITYDTEKNEISEWARMTLPFTGACSLKVVNVSVTYADASLVDTMAGFFSISNSSKFRSRLNDQQHFTIVQGEKFQRIPDIVHMPLIMPGTVNPKVIGEALLTIDHNENEIKFMITDKDHMPVQLSRGVFVFEILRKDK